MTSTPSIQPEFTIVCPVYNVEKYLGDFIRSVEEQTVPHNLIQVVAVNDGSTDNSLHLLEQWANRSDLDITVLSKPNGGLSSARNFGIDHAQGTWLTFADPDDLLDPEYFSNVQRFATLHPEVEMIQNHVINFYEDEERDENNHPRRRMFEFGDILVNLDHSSEFFPYSVATGFLRTERVRQLGLRFDDRVRPTFEDGHLIAQYLLHSPTTNVGFVASAIYYYRKRADSSSLVQGSQRSPDRYLAVPRYGYLDLCKVATKMRGQVPKWIQQWIVYELYWYFKDEYTDGMITAAHGDVATGFIDLLQQIRPYLDTDIILNTWHWQGRIPWRQALAYGVLDTQWHTPYVVVRYRNPNTDQVHLSYRYSGQQPQETITVGNKKVKRLKAETHSFRFFEHDLLFERHLWVDDSKAVEVQLNNTSVPFRDRYEQKKSVRSDGTLEPDDPDVVDSFQLLPRAQGNSTIGHKIKRTYRRLRGKLGDLRA